MTPKFHQEKIKIPMDEDVKIKKKQQQHINITES